MEDETERLLKIKALLDSGAITREEFEEMKARILEPSRPQARSSSSVGVGGQDSRRKRKQLIIVVGIVVVAMVVVFGFAAPNMGIRLLSFGGATAGHQSLSNGPSFAVTTITLHVFEYDGSPYNGYFQALNVTGVRGTSSIASIVVHLNGVNLGSPPTVSFYQGYASGQPWFARYPVLPISLKVGQTYEVQVVATLSDGTVSTISRQATATACDSVLTC